MDKIYAPEMTHQKPIQGVSAETTSGYEQCPQYTPVLKKSRPRYISAQKISALF